jgi:transporter family-2 protein
MMAFSRISAFWLTVLIIGIGLTVPIQAGVNAQLGRFINNPLFAALISFMVGTLALLVFMLVTRAPWPTLDNFTEIPWWAWCGGLFGAIFVLGTLLIAPRLGATTTLGLIVAGQLTSALIFDQFGWIGYPHHPISLMRLFGVALLILGGFLIQRF